MSKVETVGNPTKEVSQVYVGYLTGQVREILEASIADERQLTALKNIVADKIYEWWNNTGVETQDPQRHL